MEPKDIVTICLSSLSLLVAGGGLALSLYNYNRAKERYEATASTTVVDLDDRNRIRYRVIVTNTGNRPLTVDSITYKTRGGTNTEVSAGVTIAPDASSSVEFAVLPDQPQPASVEAVPHKGGRIPAPIQTKQVARRVFSETLRRCLAHSFGDMFTFVEGDRPDTILVTALWESISEEHAFLNVPQMEARRNDGESQMPTKGVGRAVLDCNVLFDGGDELCELPTDRTREAMHLLTTQNTILGQFSRSRPEGGNPKYCLTVNDRGKEAVKNPFDLLSTLYTNNALAPKVYRQTLKVF